VLAAQPDNATTAAANSATHSRLFIVIS